MLILFQERCGSASKWGGRRNREDRREQGQNASSCPWQLLAASSKDKDSIDLENTIPRWWKMLKVAGATAGCLLPCCHFHFIFADEEKTSIVSYTSGSYSCAMGVSELSFQNLYWN